MDFIRSVHNLQRKPEHVRRRILVVSVATGMFVVVGAWLMIMTRRIDNAPLYAPANLTAQIESAASPFGMLKEALEGVVSEIHTQFK